MKLIYRCRFCNVIHHVLNQQIFESREDALWKSGQTGQHACDPGITGVSDLIAVWDDIAHPQKP